MKLELNKSFLFISLSILSLVCTAQTKKSKVNPKIYLTAGAGDYLGTLQSIKDRFKKVTIIGNGNEYVEKRNLNSANIVFNGAKCIRTKDDIYKNLEGYFNKKDKDEEVFIFNASNVYLGANPSFTVYSEVSALVSSILKKKGKKISIIFNVCVEKQKEYIEASDTVIRPDAIFHTLDVSLFSRPEFIRDGMEVPAIIVKPCDKIQLANYMFEWKPIDNITDYTVLIKDSATQNICFRIDTRQGNYTTDLGYSCVYSKALNMQQQITKILNKKLESNIHFEPFYFCVGYFENNKFRATPWSKFKMVCVKQGNPDCDCKCNCH